MDSNEQSRREFLSTMTIGTLGAIGAAGMLAGCQSTGSLKRLQESSSLTFLERAPEGRVIKYGLVGCGGRGTGAAMNFFDAGPGLELVALGDVFPDRINRTRTILKEARGIEVADEMCFTGFDSYEKVIDSDVDVVLFATPPHFRPAHVKAAIEAGKHVFQEKPVAVDPVGARIMDDVTQLAKRKNLCMLSGTQGRYQKNFAETQRMVSTGIIGEITGGNVIRNGSALWWAERQPGWTDMEYMLRNWGNFCWLSGDHIVEQFVHNLDRMSWHVGGYPLKAIGYGGRQQRRSGDQFDNFSIVYEYEGGRRFHASARQIAGCHNSRYIHFSGTKGYADASGLIYDLKGELIWEYPYPDENDADQTWRVNSPVIQEHVELITAIRTGRYHNDSDEQVKSTRISIMGRMAAYTGREITWEEILNSNERLGPDSYSLGPVRGIPESPPMVGSPTKPADDRYIL